MCAGCTCCMVCMGKKNTPLRVFRSIEGTQMALKGSQGNNFQQKEQRFSENRTKDFRTPNKYIFQQKEQTFQHIRTMNWKKGETQQKEKPSVATKKVGFLQIFKSLLKCWTELSCIAKAIFIIDLAQSLKNDDKIIYLRFIY